MISQMETVTDAGNNPQQGESELWSMSMHRQIVHQEEFALSPVVVWG
jgi:hypothetical protein